MAAWRRASPENEAHFGRLVALLEATERRHAERERERAAPPPISELIGEEEVGDRDVISWPVRAAGARSRTRRPRPLRIGLATGAALVAALLLLAVFRHQQVGPGGLLLTGAEYITDINETALVRLGDGSVIRLAPESRLRVVPRSERREVWLDGRAFFAVPEHEASPFIVRTDFGRTRVLGTRFDLQARAQAIRVIVVEGRVELSTSGGKVQLGAKEVSLTREGERPAKTEVANVEGLLGWLDTFVAFQATPLRDVASEIEARFGIEVRITSSALARETVTGWSNSVTAQDFLTRICLAVAARCHFSDTLVVLEPKL